MEPDFDKDGLSDLAEFIVGTNSTNPDSDGDGIPDGAEVTQGTDPLDGQPVITGVIASVDTAGIARDVTALNSVALIADDTAGVAVFSTRDPQRPILTAQLPTPAPALRVAWDGALAAVALGPVGLGRMDLTDIALPRLLGVAAIGNVPAVAVAGNVAYAGLEQGFVVAVDLATGVEIQLLAAGGSVHDLVVSGEALVIATASELLTISLVAEGMRVFSRSATSFIAESITSSRRVFAADGLAMVTSYPGFDTFDFRVNRQLRRLAPARDTGPNSFKQIVANGSGLGIAAVGVNPRADGTHNVWLYDLRDPLKTDAFQTVLPTPGTAHGVSIFNGLAYVADGEAGLQVVNYLPYDNRGVPPTIELVSEFGDSAVEAGQFFRVTARVTDDVQVRNVAFLVDGQPAVVDGSYPFEIRLLAPQLTATKTSIQVEAIATDTGGNSTRSRALTLELLPDVRPPRVTRVDPASPLLITIDTMRIFVNEPLNPATLSASAVRVFSAGGDEAFGTADDVEIQGVSRSYRGDLGAVVVQFNPRLASANYLLRVSGPLADLAGLAIVDYEHRFRVISGADADGDGVPDEIEPALGLDPTRRDTDGDGILDGWEDFDGDGLVNAAEIAFNNDPANPDSNGNGIRDGAEDADGDGLADSLEFFHATQRLVPDTDGDGWNDEMEVTAGSNPLNPASRPRTGLVSLPPITVIAPAIGTDGGLPRNSIIGLPPITVIAPATGTDGGLARNSVVGLPPVTVIAPALGNDSGLPRNSVIGLPPVTVIAPAPGNPAGLPPNTVVAQPPITFTIQ